MVVIDLDGTLVRGNTFRMFIRHLAKISLKRKKPKVAAGICVLLALRMAGLITHRRMKWYILRLSDEVMTARDMKSFAATLPGFFNPQVKALISGRECVLATAAPEEYVAPLAQLLGVDYVATQRPTNGKYHNFIECRGSYKLRQVEKQWGKPQDVVTDHADDLALLAAATGRRILVHPSASTVATVQLAGIPVEVWA